PLLPGRRLPGGLHRPGSGGASRAHGRATRVARATGPYGPPAALERRQDLLLLGVRPAPRLRPRQPRRSVRLPLRSPDAVLRDGIADRARSFHAGRLRRVLPAL